MLFLTVLFSSIMTLDSKQSAISWFLLDRYGHIELTITVSESGQVSLLFILIHVINDVDSQ